MKTKTSHTPGPWRQTSYMRKPGEVFIVGSKCEARPPICACHPDNAPLISAAPELLEVAKEAESLISLAADKEVDPIIMFATLENIKAAIARAEGK